MTSSAELSGHLGGQVTVQGMAGNAKLGAVVMTSDRQPVYIAGLDEWDDALNRRTVAVTGRLEDERIGPAPVVGPNGAQSTGIEGSCLVLHDATWRLSD